MPRCSGGCPVTGGPLWGRRRHTRTWSAQLAGLTAWLPIGVAVAAAAANLIALGVVLAVTGVAVAPLFVVSYVVADEPAPAHQRTEAGTWVNTANNLGSAAGASVAVVLVDHVSIASGFGAGALLALCASMIWLLGHHPERRRR
ncbi:MAG TPA: MFS transporter [Pseudonocardiaceae bacterium]|nr:MFS transporter [Pseudonocardiaceae bacterium]